MRTRSSLRQCGHCLPDAFPLFTIFYRAITASEFFLHAANMAPAQSFDFAALLQIALYLLIIEYAKAIHYCNGLAGRFEDLSGVQIEVLSMAYSEDQSINAVECFVEVFVNL